MGAIQELAVDLHAQERTLRRAAAQGALRSSRIGPRRLRLADGEREYLRLHWPLLAMLRRILRTEHRVRLAVLYGSVARGDDDEGSDLDLLISLADDSPAARSRLSARLQHLTDRHVDIALVKQVELQSPLLLERVLDEGRVLVDRDDQWRELRERVPAIRARGRRAHRKQMTDAARAIEEMIGER